MEISNEYAQSHKFEPLEYAIDVLFAEVSHHKYITIYYS